MRILAFVASLLVLSQVHAQTTVAVPAPGVSVTVNWADFKENFCVYGGAVYSLNSLICIGTQAHTCGRADADKVANWKTTGTCK
ncbi:MAG: hypothetical protein JO055_14645 [Alphaproteobacteria bacterium]|nr:hypothetical protein [Alphaproteobacteria bacterium]